MGPEKTCHYMKIRNYTPGVMEQLIITWKPPHYLPEIPGEFFFGISGNYLFHYLSEIFGNLICKVEDCRSEVWGLKLSGPQKGPAERVRSKIVKIKMFRQFLRRAKNVKSRQEVSKTILTFFDHLRAVPIFRPVLGGLWKNMQSRRMRTNGAPKQVVTA